MFLVFVWSQTLETSHVSEGRVWSVGWFHGTWTGIVIACAAEGPVAGGGRTERCPCRATLGPETDNL